MKTEKVVNVDQIWIVDFFPSLILMLIKGKCPKFYHINPKITDTMAWTILQEGNTFLNNEMKLCKFLVLQINLKIHNGGRFYLTKSLSQTSFFNF